MKTDKKLSRTRAKIAIVLMVLGVLVILVGFRYVLAMGAGAILVVAGYAMQLFGLRCPNCHKGYAAAQWKQNGTQRCTKCNHTFIFDK